MAFSELFPLDHNFIPGAMVSGTVGSLIDNGDDFLFYPINGSEVIVDVSPLPAWQLGLMPGEIITLQVGEWNGREIDTNNIIRPDGSTVLGLSSIPPMTIPPNIDSLTGVGLTTLSGTVISQTEPDSFFFQSDIGPILVDAIPQGEGIVTVIPGEILTIVGNFDDYDFDAYSLTRLDGSPVLPNQPPIMGFTPPSIPPINPEFLTLSGTVISQTEPDSFFFQSDIGPILVDAIPQGEGMVTVIPGEILTIVGNFDDYDFDAYSLTRLDGSPVLPNQPPMMGFTPPSIPPINPEFLTLSGTVISQTEPDSFFFQSDIGPILVDAIPQGEGMVTVIPGEILTIVGNFDDYDFDAYSLTRLDGSPVLPNQPPMMGFTPPSIPPINPVLSNRIQMEITDINNPEFAPINNIPNPPLNPGNRTSPTVGDRDYNYDQPDFDYDHGRSRRFN
ncbi:hypothetical protein L1F28_11300 [Arthrospira platensis NCB002]|uniref:hypothetical protein n=1 Tax=Limnospira platensis TaxID=118562 RepID=UPI0001D0E65A|nr:hypothetical protein [Arthrospira platensis NCB002]BAI90046.1 hypothetical protein NIES39_D06290 [Arthrospira platensis NIES-39]BDT12372.1 hypothetical protein N39L_20950 [Arthrospira platensis NIES-39]